jgi:rhodanese-related sulfurtransferase
MKNVFSNLPLDRVMPIAISTATALKSRLVENTTGLTIVDLRDPETFDREHPIGAISVPFARIADLAT